MNDSNEICEIFNSTRNLFLFLVVLLLLGSCASKECETVDLTIAMTDQHKKILDFLGEGEWIKKATACRVGEYIVYGPSDKSTESLFITKDGNRLLLISNNLGINLYEPSSGKRNKYPLVNMQDRNKDGLLDSIYYKAFDLKGQIKTEILDRNLDGSPDTKIAYDDNDEIDKFYIWLRDAWHMKESRNNEDGVVIGGKWYKIKFVDGYWSIDE